MTWAKRADTESPRRTNAFELDRLGGGRQAHEAGELRLVALVEAVTSESPSMRIPSTAPRGFLCRRGPVPPSPPFGEGGGGGAVAADIVAG